jgi:hypothetical protein
LGETASSRIEKRNIEMTQNQWKKASNIGDCQKLMHEKFSGGFPGYLPADNGGL